MAGHLQKGFCPRCPHFKTCGVPCFPVAEYLKKDNLAVFEKHHTNEKGETLSIVFARSRETPESELPQVFEDTGTPADKPQRVFSTESESPFSTFNPRLKQTGIFVDRFFHRFSYEDLAVKYEMSTENAIKTYHNAVKRVLAVLEIMDKGNAAGNFDPWRRQVEERSGSLPKGQKWFLLNKLFGLRPSEIAKMEGLRESSSVRQLIIRVSDQLLCGEIKLIDFSPQEAEEAKARLESHNARRRERYANKKRLSLSNLGIKDVRF